MVGLEMEMETGNVIPKCFAIKKIGKMEVVPSLNQNETIADANCDGN